MIRLYKRAVKVMKPFIENATLEAQEAKIHEEYKEMVCAKIKTSPVKFFIARLLPSFWFVSFYEKHIKNTKESETADFIIACFSNVYLKQKYEGIKLSLYSDLSFFEPVFNSAKSEEIDLPNHIKMKLRYNRLRKDWRLR